MANSPENQLVDRMVPSGGVIHLVRALEDSGVDYSSIRKALGADFSQLTAQNTRIRASKIAEVYGLAMMLPVPGDFWLKLGDSYSVHNYHLELSNWILTGKNIAEIMPKLHGLYGGDPEVTSESFIEGQQSSPGDDGWIKQPVATLDRDHPAFVVNVELSAATLVRGFKSLLGERELQCRFYFDYPEPEYGDVYRQILGSEVFFDAEQTEFHILRDYFYQSFLSSDAVMHQFYEEQLTEFFKPRDKSESLVAQVEAILLDYHGNFPSLPQICEELKLGERTLRRALQAQGTSYRELLLNTKMKRAEYYLQHTDIGIEEIAYRLDYSDYANFRRAFQSVYQQTPSSYRKSFL